MEIREVYRSGDVFHLNVTAFPPHLQRFVVFYLTGRPSLLIYHFRWLAHPIHLQSQTHMNAAGCLIKLNPKLFGCLTLTRPILVG
jgi:hypothetical protein